MAAGDGGSRLHRLGSVRLPVIESMIDDVFRAPRRFMTPLNVQGPALPALLGVSANTVQGRLRADAPLVRSGLISVDSDGDLKALDRLNRFAAAPAGSGTDVHRLLEVAPTPTLWTMNSTRGVSETILRGMMFALELRRPTPRVRARIWARELARHGIEAPSEDVLSLAREFEATPGVGAGATAAAGLAGGGIDAVRHGVRSLSRVLGCEKPPQGPPPRFDLGLIHADTDPVTLAERLVQNADRGFSLCLQGPPGTGKSAFARYLAERVGLEVLQKRASDLLSPWVGETEQQIAAAFAEARDSEAFLIFDEADSLLADRRSAHRSWEVSQVNEMLTWMASHPLPFACTSTPPPCAGSSSRCGSTTSRRRRWRPRSGPGSRSRHPPASRTLPPLRPGTSRWCTGRRGSSQNTASPNHSRPCSAPSATQSRTAPARSGSGRSGEGRGTGDGLPPPSWFCPPQAPAIIQGCRSKCSHKPHNALRTDREPSCDSRCASRGRPAD